MTVLTSFPQLPTAPAATSSDRPCTCPADAATQRRRRLRLARTLAGVSVRRRCCPGAPSAAGSGSASAARPTSSPRSDVRVQVVGAAVPWPRLGRVVVSDHTGWLGDLALSTAVPGTPVLGRDAARVLPVGSVACPVVLRYRTAAGYLPAGEIPRTLAEITAARDLVVEVHRLPALLPEPAAAGLRSARSRASRIPAGAAILPSATRPTEEDHGRSELVARPARRARAALLDRDGVERARLRPGRDDDRPARRAAATARPGRRVPAPATRRRARLRRRHGRRPPRREGSWKDRLKQVADQGKAMAEQGKQKVAEQQSKRTEQWANDPNTLWFGESKGAATSAMGVSKARYRITKDRVWIESGLLGTKTENVPLWSVKDIDVRQAVWQRDKDIGDVVLTLDDASYAAAPDEMFSMTGWPTHGGGHGTTTGQVVLDNIENPYGVVDIITPLISEARHKKTSSGSRSTCTSTRAWPGRRSGRRRRPRPPARPAAGRHGQQLRKLGELRDAGILTEEEFAAQKAKILGA